MRTIEARKKESAKKAIHLAEDFNVASSLMPMNNRLPAPVTMTEEEEIQALLILAEDEAGQNLLDNSNNLFLESLNLDFSPEVYVPVEDEQPEALEERDAVPMPDALPVAVDLPRSELIASQEELPRPELLAAREESPRPGLFAPRVRLPMQEVLVAREHEAHGQLQAQGLVNQSHFLSYLDRQIDCPAYLETGIKRQQKLIFEKLHADGARFLSKTKMGVRCWNNYPSHEKTFFQALQTPRHQIYFPSSPKDIIYKGTWVSAVVKDAQGTIYPLHIVTKNTLGAVNNILQYPSRIRAIFSGEDFPAHWPESLVKECIVICADKPEQQRQIFSDYEKLVLTQAASAIRTVPNIRVFCSGALSEMKTVETCRQQSLASVMKPNLVNFAQRWQELLNLEQVEIDARGEGLRHEDFIIVSQQFFSPAPLSHEMALSHFSFLQLQRFSLTIKQSRDRMIDLKRQITERYRGPQMQDPDLREFIAEIDTVIRRRTPTISRLNNLAQQYVSYIAALTNLLLIPAHVDLAQGEAAIYDHIQKELEVLGGDSDRLVSRFGSGKALIAWLLTNNVPTQSFNALMNSIIEHFPRGDNQQIRVF